MNRRERARPAPIGFGLSLALVLWLLVFIIRPLPFFWSMTLATSILSVVAWRWGSVRCQMVRLSLKETGGGLISALLLYVIFFYGNHLLQLIFRQLDQLPLKQSLLENIYQRGSGFDPALKTLLLVFPIAFGEELFWRGFIQTSLAKQFTPVRGWLLATAAYTIVHFPTGNTILILSAFACGLFWGYLFMRTGSLTLVMISHMVWDPLIFVILPIR